MLVSHNGVEGRLRPAPVLDSAQEPMEPLEALEFVRVPQPGGLQ